MFAIAAAIVTGVIIPVAGRARHTGETAWQKGRAAGTQLEEIFK